MTELLTADFDYDLPEGLIAQRPLAERDQSRLLVLDQGAPPAHRCFSDLPTWLRPGDCLVLNNTRVLPARLFGRRQDSGRPVELLLLRRLSETDWLTLVKPGRHCKPGVQLEFVPGRLQAQICSIETDGSRVVRFEFSGIWEEVLAEAGEMPLPPYIHEHLDDPERYQTVYASATGSAAAPTAGLHFTPALLKQIAKMGVELVEITLHVGLGTFRPVRADKVSQHEMHSEYFEVTEAAAARINAAKRSGGRIIAVGTTACRVLESQAGADGMLRAGSGWTDIFIYPGYSFRLLDGLITNFHLPRSTLLMLVCALYGQARILDAYRLAIARQYRFFSFGDAMLILPERT